MDFAFSPKAKNHNTSGRSSDLLLACAGLPISMPKACDLLSKIFNRKSEIPGLSKQGGFKISDISFLILEELPLDSETVTQNGAGFYKAYSCGNSPGFSPDSLLIPVEWGEKNRRNLHQEPVARQR